MPITHKGALTATLSSWLISELPPSWARAGCIYYMKIEFGTTGGKAGVTLLRTVTSGEV